MLQISGDCSWFLRYTTTPTEISVLLLVLRLQHQHQCTRLIRRRWWICTYVNINRHTQIIQMRCFFFLFSCCVCALELYFHRHRCTLHSSESKQRRCGYKIFLESAGGVWCAFTTVAVINRFCSFVCVHDEQSNAYRQLTRKKKYRMTIVEFCYCSTRSMYTSCMHHAYTMFWHNESIKENQPTKHWWVINLYYLMVESWCTIDNRKH